MAAKKAKWKPGDVVRLKSGGPAMTVEMLYDGVEQNTRCAYFRGGDALFVNLAGAALELAKANT